MTASPHTQPASGAAAVDPGAATRMQGSGLTTRTLIRVVELGILGDFLLRAGDLGINLTIWCWALLASGMVAASAATTDRRRGALLAAAAFFAAVPAWRDDPALVLLSGVAVIMLLVLLTWTAGEPDVSLAHQREGAYVGAARRAAGHILAGPVPLIRTEVTARALAGRAHRRPAFGVLRGLLLALPVILIFGSLLVEADAAYASVVSRFFRWEMDTLISHIVLTAVFAWLGAAYLTATVQWTRIQARTLPRITLGAIEAATVLALVDALFLSFVAVQAGYLFGGVSRVMETVGLTYAEYARRGFFELVTVSVLALPLLMVLSATAKLETLRQRRVHVILATALVGLLFLMMISALSRMWMYQAEYGWTLSRLHATMLMLWIGGSIAWFTATVLRGAPERFVLGSLGGALAILAALVVANPAAAITRLNVERAAAGAEFDVEHALGMGADAAPALLAALPVLERQLDTLERCMIARQVAEIMRRDGGAVPGGDWRTWTLARARARAAAARLAPAVRAALPAVADCARPS